MYQLPELSTVLSPSATTRPAEDEVETAYWRSPLLHVLGERSCYRPSVFIPKHTHRQTTKGTWVKVTDIRDDILRAGGVDPKGPKSMGFRVGKKVKTMNIRECLNQTAYINSENRKTPHGNAYTITRRVDYEGNLDPNGKAMAWALTPKGVAAAAHLRHAFTHGPNGEILDRRNITNLWLSGQCTHHDLYNKVVLSVSRHPKLCREAGNILDHVNAFFVTAIRRNAFRTHIESMKPPTIYQIKAWVLNACYSTYRARSQDAQTRTTYGALTKQEQDAGGPMTSSMVASPYRRVFQDSPEEDSKIRSEVLVDQDATRRMFLQLGIETGMEKVYSAIRREKSKNPDRFERIFQLMVRGHSVTEIGHLVNCSAEREAELRAAGYTTANIGLMTGGVSRNRAATLMADTRQALRTAQHTAFEGILVLKYIRDEPYATREDILEDVSLKSRLPVILKALIDNGRITAQESTHKSKTVYAYTITDRGESHLQERRFNLENGENLIESLSL